MARQFVFLISFFLLLSSCTDSLNHPNRDSLFQEIIAGMPDYQDFLTVDELHNSLDKLKQKYPELVSLNVLGWTENGIPIYEFKIGSGKHHALLFGFPHPNEPIGSVMLHYLTRCLAENRDLRNYFDFTWHIVICAEPDKAKLNEGWFKGRLSLTKYARNYYRPPSHQQVEWTFPISYKSYHFNSPIPEAVALMKIIDRNPISFSFGLHNSGFGGVYYYWSHYVPELYPVFYKSISEQGLPLHLGEPEVPWGVKFDDKSMFRMIYFTENYDYLEEYSPTPPGEVLKSGGSSDDYIRAKYNALTVNCELPYFYDPRIEDTSPSDMSRRDCQLKSIELGRELFRSVKSAYEEVKPFLIKPSPFVDVIEEVLRTGENNLTTMENTVKRDPEYERTATVAEKWDALSLSEFRSLLILGQFVRLLEYEKAQVGESFPAKAQEILDGKLQEFSEKAQQVETNLTYSVVPIKKLATIQLVTALYSMDYVQSHPEFSGR